MEKYEKVCKTNKFKMPAPRWNDKFELPEGLCSKSDIQVHFEYILKNIEKRLMIF